MIDAIFYKSIPPQSQQQKFSNPKSLNYLPLPKQKFQNPSNILLLIFLQKIYITYKQSPMTDVKSKKASIVGYMGYIPSNESSEQQQNQYTPIEAHVPGYVGYIPAVKSQNLYAKTYGKITQNCNKGNYYKGIEMPIDVKYTSTTKQTYVHPNKIKEQEQVQGKISGVKVSTFSNAAKWMIDTQGVKKDYEPEQHSSLTYEEACRKAYK